MMKKTTLVKYGEFIYPYLGFIFALIILIPWIFGNLKLHNSTDVLTLTEVFVLSSATLSLVTFTYLIAMTDLHEKIKSSMVTAGELFFIATVEFIVGLGIFLGVNFIFDHYISQNFSLSLNGMAYFILIIAQIIGIYEVSTALYKFLRGIFEVYRSFRSRSQTYAIYKTIKKLFQ
jgi:hypothetical protein